MTVIQVFVARTTLLLLLLLLLANNIHTTVHGQPVLDLDYLTSTEIAADLSTRVYDDFPGDEDDNGDHKYDRLHIYRDGPERALLATKNGRCYVSFRGFDIWSVRDIFQENVLRGLRNVCPPTTTVTAGGRRRDAAAADAAGNTTTPSTTATKPTPDHCCQARAPIWVGYDTKYRAQLEKDIFTCRKLNCKDPEDDCLFLTGYSSGGGIAQVAAIMLQDAHAHVISFGTESTLNPECGATAHLNTSRWVRWANTRTNERRVGLQYDRYPWEAKHGLVSFGYTYLVSKGGVANIGLNPWGEEYEEAFTPHDPLRLYRSHRMYTHESRDPGYGDQIEILLSQGNFPIPTSGYAVGSFCSIDKECASGECGDSGTCE
jgi:hypothetical protein